MCVDATTCQNQSRFHSSVVEKRRVDGGGVESGGRAVKGRCGKSRRDAFAAWKSNGLLRALPAARLPRSRGASSNCGPGSGLQAGGDKGVGGRSVHARECWCALWARRAGLGRALGPAAACSCTGMLGTPWPAVAHVCVLSGQRRPSAGPAGGCSPPTGASCAGGAQGRGSEGERRASAAWAATRALRRRGAPPTDQPSTESRSAAPRRPSSPQERVSGADDEGQGVADGRIGLEHHLNAALLNQASKELSKRGMAQRGLAV